MQQESDYGGKPTLESMKEAVNYNRYLESELLAFISPHTSAIDFGAGDGEFAQRLRARGIEVTTVEIDDTLRGGLARHGFTVATSIAEVAPHARIYSQNVLEHIEDDDTALRAMHAALTGDGKLLLYVPAFQCIFTRADAALGHFRRYRKTGLVEKLTQAGFMVERAEYVDSIGFLCWFAAGRLPWSGQVNPRMARLFDRFIFPLSRLVDRMTHRLFGKNVLVIARK